MEEKKLNVLPFEIGKCYFIRGVTYHMLGRVQKIIGKFLVLEESSWVADSGRFSDAIAKGTLDEVEPVGISIVNTYAINDAIPWVHDLPKERK